MNRSTVMVEEKKEKIAAIKKKYDNLSMSDKAADKIIRLETLNSILKLATASVGIITVVDYVVPDPVLGLDEAALTGITGLFGYAVSVVNNKIDAIAKDEDSSMKIEEVNNLSNQLKGIVKGMQDRKLASQEEASHTL